MNMVRNSIVWSFTFVILLVGTASSNSIVASWKFDESTGSVASDSSSNGYDGTLVNMDDSDWVTGQSGNALDFDGIDDYVEISGYKAVTGANSRTCSAWIKTSFSGNVQMITSWGASAIGQAWMIYIDQNGKLNVNVYGGSITGTAVLNDGSWHHIAVVLGDDLNADGRIWVEDICLYVDTLIDPVSSVNTGSDPGAQINTSSDINVTLGVRNYGDLRPDLGYSFYFQGLIDDVRIYDYALSSGEIYHTQYPDNAWAPSPDDGIGSLETEITLSWSAGNNAISHDVYFGTDKTAVTNAQRLAGDINGNGTVDIDDLEELALRWLSSADLDDFAVIAAGWGLSADPEFKGNQTTTSFDPELLPEGKTYYWRIDEVNGSVTTTGRVWSFTSTFRLWQLPAQSSIQMNSYVIQTHNGSVIVVDGGTVDDATYLKNFLANLGNHVNMWFVSHRHHDHIGALTVILQDIGSLQIDTIYGSMPTMSWLQTYDTNAYDQTLDFNAALSAVGKTVTEVSLGQMISLDGVNIKILGIKNPEFTSGNDNDQSMVMKVWDGAKSVMFLGDLYINGGNKLLNTWGSTGLNSDYVQMAHHGQAGVDFNVYQAISPTYCLWPTPLWLWNNDNGGGYDSGPWLTLVVRAWMDSLGVQGHYCMFDGLQTIP